MADGDDGLAAAGDRRLHVPRGRTWSEAIVRLRLDAGGARDLLCRLAGTEQRARDDGIRPLHGELLAQRARSLTAARRQRAQLVGVAGHSLGVANEEEADRARVDGRRRRTGP